MNPKCQHEWVELERNEAAGHIVSMCQLCGEIDHDPIEPEWAVYEDQPDPDIWFDDWED